MKLKALLLCSLAVASLGTANAAEITVAGTTTGAFNGGAFADISGLDGLIFDGLNFDQSTVNNQLGLNLGLFSLGGTAATYNGDTFSLQVLFTAPAGIVGTNPATFTAALSGTVQNNNTGGVDIFFTNPIQNYTFASGGTTGNFSIRVNNLTLEAGEAGINLTALVTGQQVETPRGVPDGGTTVALLGLSLVGIAAVKRKLALA